MLFAVFSIKHWRKFGGAPPEGVGQAVGQAAAILRKASERKKAFGGRGFGDRGGGGGRGGSRSRSGGTVRSSRCGVRSTVATARRRHEC